MKNKQTSATAGFWDNLISIKAGTADPQYAGWKPKMLRKSGLGCLVLANQRVPVSEGISHHPIYPGTMFIKDRKLIWNYISVGCWMSHTPLPACKLIK